MDSLNFGKDDIKDKYDEFIIDYNDFIKDDLSVQKAKRLASSSWHLVDWTFEEYKSIHNFNNIGDYRDSLYPKCFSLKIMHDITNTTKHKLLNRPKADLKNTKEHQGDFSSDFSFDFDISYLELEKNDGTILSFREESDKVKIFWDDYFNDKIKTEYNKTYT